MSLVAFCQTVSVPPDCCVLKISLFSSPLMPLIESPSLAQFSFDSDQAQQAFSHFLTLMIFCQSRAGMALAQSLSVRLRLAGRAQQPGALGSKGKADGKTKIVICWRRDTVKSHIPLMACRTEREEPGPRYHPCSFGRTLENYGKAFSFDRIETALANGTNHSS